MEKLKKPKQLRNYSHYATDPVRMSKALVKRKNTLSAKYTPDDIARIAKARTEKGFDNINSKLEVAPIYERNVFLGKINSLQLSNFTGKSGNRKLISLDPALYKSLIHYTNFLAPYVNKIWFGLRLRIAFNNLTVSDDSWCLCRSKISYDPQTSDFTKRFCQKCKLPPHSKKWYKFFFKDNWEEKYNEFINDPERKIMQQRAGRNSWFARKGSKFLGCLCRGRNEEKILNYLEQTNNITIQRGINICGYYVDGFCKETNTVYEIYESYHIACKTQIEYDTIRQKEIMQTKGCNFSIVFDTEDTLDLNNFKIQDFYAKD